MRDYLERPPIAIVGVGAMFPGRGGTVGFWRDLVEGRDAITEVPPTHWAVEDYYDPDPKAPDKTYCKRGAFIPAFPFDPVEFGVPPNVIEATDTFQLLALHVAKEVIAEAGKARFGHIDRERTSVVLGVAVGSELMTDMSARLFRPVWLKALREAGVGETKALAICDRISSHFGEWRESTFPGLLGNVVAGRITNRLDIGGTNFTADAACASSLAALRHAVQELWLGESDLVLTGGSDALNNIFMYMCFSKTPAMSPTGDCRPFSESADGTILGEGAGIFALRRLADAERDGDTIYAVIRGVGASSDGRANSVYAPRAEGQALALKRAYQQAGYSPRSVELVEAHGTGTRAGDAAEFAGLSEVFKAADPSGRQWCALGSIKSQIGHTKSAAGAAGLMKAVLALHHKVLPPTLKAERPSAKLGVETSPFYLITQARPWIHAPLEPRRASVSSFGFGGSNFHVTLEEYHGPAPKPARFRAFAAELVLLSGDSAAALVERARSLAQSTQRDDSLAPAAAKSCGEFDATEPHRLAVVASSAAELQSRIGEAVRQIEKGAAFATPDVAYGSGARATGAIAFLFSGQGSQYPNMGGSLAMAFDDARKPFDDLAGAALFDGESLHDIVFPKSAGRDGDSARHAAALTATENAQPAIAAVQLAHLALLRRLGVAPDAVAGHSFGEVMALHAAGCFDAPAAVRLARQRGLAMRDAARGAEGAMLAVQLNVESVRAMLAKSNSKAVIGNDNSPRQVILSGSVVDIEIAAREFAAAGVDVKQLPVATAFHSPIVAGAVDSMRRAIGAIAFAPPSLPVYANATAARYPDRSDAAAEQLARQIGEAVRFRELVETMYRDGVRTFIEIGPGSILTGLVGQILASKEHLALALDNKRADGVVQLLRCLGRLAVAGVRMDFTLLTEGWRGLAEPPVPPKHAVWLCGSNHNKPRPTKLADELTAPEPVGGVEAARDQAPAQGDQADMAAAPSPLAADAIMPLEPLARGAASEQRANQSTAPARAPFDREGPLSVLQPQSEEPEMTSEEMLALRAMQETAALEHRRFLETISQAHLSFLQLCDSAVAQARELRTDRSVTLTSHNDAAALRIAGPADDAPRRAAGASAPPLALQPPAASERRADMATPGARDLEEVAALADTPVPIVEPTPPLAAPTPATDMRLAEIVREIVAEKTGYPAEMLDIDMELEAELGVDSIKQVEILAALRERLPAVPEITPARLAELRSLRQIAAALGESSPQDGPATALAATPVPIAEPTPPLAAPTPATDMRLAEIVREIVAEKTGYPAEMLDIDMELEAELGVDSIKQVEILAALRERLPAVPEITPTRLAELRSLRQIAAALGESSPQDGPATALAATPVPIAEPTPPLAAPTPATDMRLAEIVREIVAEKTGYPAEMLEFDMELEAELGVDSIKQVEILAALRERLPDMPEIAPARLAELRSLRQIAAALAPAGTPNGRSAASLGSEADNLARKSGVYRQIVVLEDRAASGRPMPGFGARARIAVTEDHVRLAEALVSELSQHGFEAGVGLAARDDASIVISTAGLADHLDPESVHLAALRAARALAPRVDAGGAVFVTLQDTGGRFARDLESIEPAWRSGLTGLVKTARFEWPEAAVKAIDVERAGQSNKDVARRVVDELLQGGPDIEVGLPANGQRLVPVVKTAPLGEIAAPRLRDGLVVVASGGGRGVTAESIIRLAGAARMRFALLGRTELAEWPADIAPDAKPADIRAILARQAAANGQKPSPREIGRVTDRLIASREIRETMKRIEAAGSEALYKSADVGDEAAVTRALNEIRGAWGSINGLAHGAGLLADKLIKDKTDEQASLVFRAKAGGLAALIGALRDDPLEFVTLFSSIAARYGNPGQADYAMANEILNRVAWVLAKTRRACRVTSINWGPWEGGMAHDLIRAQFAARGVPIAPVSVGADGFVREVAGGDGHVEIVFAGLPDTVERSNAAARPESYPRVDAIALGSANR